MQIEPNITIFDTTHLSAEHPLSPEGSLYSAYLSEVPAPLHYHDFFEIGYCERGTGVFNVGGDLIPFHGECVSIIYEGQAHIAQSTNTERSFWHFLYIDLPLLFAGGSFPIPETLGQLRCLRWQDYSFPCILPRDEYPDFFELVRQILAESSAMEPGALGSIRGLVYALLTKHERLFVPLPSGTSAGSPSRIYLMQELEPALNYINRHFSEPITVDQLVAVSSLSKSNLQRKMIALTGRPPLRYVHLTRLKYACALLADRSRSIAEAAAEVGYNLSSFNREFRREFGMSPSEWMKKNI